MTRPVPPPPRHQHTTNAPHPNTQYNSHSIRRVCVFWGEGWGAGHDVFERWHGVLRVTTSHTPLCSWSRCQEPGGSRPRTAGCGPCGDDTPRGWNTGLSWWGTSKSPPCTWHEVGACTCTAKCRVRTPQHVSPLPPPPPRTHTCLLPHTTVSSQPGCGSSELAHGKHLIATPLQLFEVGLSSAHK